MTFLTYLAQHHKPCQAFYSGVSMSDAEPWKKLWNTPIERCPSIESLRGSDARDQEDKTLSFGSIRPSLSAGPPPSKALYLSARSMSFPRSAINKDIRKENIEKPRRFG